MSPCSGTLEEKIAEDLAPGLTYEGRRYEFIIENWRTVESSDWESSELETPSSSESSSISRAMASSAIGVEADKFSICEVRIDTNPEDPVVVGGCAILVGSIDCKNSSR